MFALPLSYFLSSLFFRDNFRDLTDNISVLLIESLFFVRIVILPCIYSFYPSLQLFEGRATVETGFNAACLLMVYEVFMVQFMIFLYKHTRHNSSEKKTFKNSAVDISKGLIIFLALYIVIVSFALPNYKENFKSILSLGDANFTVASERLEYSIGTFGRIIKTLYSIGFQLFRVLFPAYIINREYNHDNYSKKSNYLLLACCTLQFLFLTSTFAEAIVACLAIILYYLSLYPERKKKTYAILGASTFGMVLIYFSVRYFVNTSVGLYYKDNGVATYAGQIINAYFTGVDNVAAIFNIPSGHQVEAFKSGIIGAIPFNSTLFGVRGNKLQYFYNSANMSYGQIPPTIGAGYYYFGPILSPIITAIFVVMSMHYNLQSKRVGKSLRQISYNFCSIVFALGTVMYSPSITLAWYLSWGIPMVIITMFTNPKHQGTEITH
jgi:hypothetical protein